MLSLRRGHFCFGGNWDGKRLALLELEARALVNRIYVIGRVIYGVG
jgi:hypothetical protein